jgi:hypothetical protein
MQIALQFLDILLKLFSISETLRTHTAKRHVFSRAHFTILAVRAGEVFAAADAGLRKNNFFAEDVADCVDEFFDVIVTFYGEKSRVSVIIQPQPD